MEFGLAAVWLLAYLALGALALPLAAALLRPFPDDGAGFAVPVALAVLGVVGFWVGRLAFGWPALVAGLAALAALSALALRYGPAPDRRRFGETMGVFAVAFLFLLAVRALDPAVHPGGGEKFLDFGMLSALARASTLPPEDFWFAGEPVQYYYGGHMLAALLGRLTGTAPRFAYNLALPGFYAAFVTAAYSLAGAVATARGRSRVSAGLFAAFLVGLASNLATPVRALAWLVGDAAPLELLGLDPRWAGTVPGDFSYWPASRVVELGAIRIPSEFPLFAYLNGDLHAHMMSPPLTLLLAATLYAYWRTPAVDLSRRRLLVFGAVPPVAGLVAVVNTWSFPTTLGVTWLGLALAPADPRHLLPLVGRSPADGRARTDRSGVGADGGLARLFDEGGRTATALGLAALCGLLAAVWVVPFLTGTTSGRGVGFVAPGRRAGLESLLVVHGAFLALTARYLGGRLLAARSAAAPDRGRPDTATLAGVAVVSVLGLAALVTVVVPLVADTPPRVLGVVPFVLVVVVGWVSLRGDAASVPSRDSDGRPDTDPTAAPEDTSPEADGDRRGVGYETVLLVGAAGLVTLVEFVYVTDTGPGRFNTVFKTYAQVWALSAVAGGVVLAEYADPAGWVARLFRAGDRSRRSEVATDGGPRPERRPDDGGPAVPTVGGVLAAVFVLVLSVYGGFALAEHVAGAEERGPATLDSLRFAEREHSLEWPAIQYVRGLSGTPTVVTAPAERIYGWSSDFWVRRTPAPAEHRIQGGAAAASLSGVPTLAGWVHEVGYRGQAAWDERVRVTDTLYDAAPARQAAVLRAQSVAYVYVGPAECQRYGDPGFDRLRGVEPVPESADWEYVTIYRVETDAVGVAGSASGADGVDPCAAWE